MASTKLRLLIDASITEPLASLVLALVPSAVLSRHKVGQAADDKIIVELANKDRRTIVAMDSDFKKYKVVGGVIRLFPERSDDDCLFAIFRTFWHSGFRSTSRKRRTSLTNDGLRITNGTPVEHKWNPKPCANRMPLR